MRKLTLIERNGDRVASFFFAGLMIGGIDKCPAPDSKSPVRFLYFNIFNLVKLYHCETWTNQNGAQGSRCDASANGG